MKNKTDYTFEDVVECNKSWIHCKDGTDEWSVKANPDRLKEIHSIASDRTNFYMRMWNVIHNEYHDRHEELEKEKMYSQEEIEEAKDWRKYGLTKSAELEHQNRTVLEKYLRLSGFLDAASWAYDMQRKYYKLAQQARTGLS